MNDVTPSFEPEAIRHRVLSEQVTLMCRLTPIPLLGSIVIGALVAYVVARDSGWPIGAAWYAAALAIMFARWQVARSFPTRKRDYTATLRWRTGMLTLIAVFGAIWSIPVSWLLPVDPVREIVMSVLFIGATATGVASLSPVRYAYGIFVTPFVTPYVVTQLLMGGDRALIALAAALYVPVMTLIANRQTQLIERRIKLAIENEALALELTTERDRVAAANRELQAQMERVNILNRHQELRAAELRAANDDLEGFSYSVSHDLRAPLRAIDGFAYLLAERKIAAGDPESAYFLNRIRENIGRMSAMIDDLLTFARCGREPLQLRELDMRALAQAALDEVRASRAALAVDAVIEPLPSAWGDRSLILQVWVNLIDNACKYSSKAAQPTVTVRGREETERVVYEVIDNGVGFDAQFSDKLFGVFQRLHSGSEYAGAGVGLAIVQRIVAKHGGEAWGKPRETGGAIFGFSLPKGSPHRD